MTAPISIRLRTPAIFIASILVGLASITGQSLWMDEGSTVFKALIPNLGDWWRMTLRLGGSDVQMPVYMFLVWLWEKLGASSEYALRVVNLPWLILGAIALRNVRFWPLVFLTSPFVLYYTGELRPYAMQAAAGAVAAAAIFRVHSGTVGSSDFKGLHSTAAAAIFLAACSLIGAVWAAALWICVLILQPDWLKRAGFWKRILPWLPVAAILGGFYGFTLIKGYRAVGAEGGIASMLFGLYELMGLMGLGPGRNEIRANPTCIIRSFPILIPAVGCFLVAWLTGALEWWRNSNRRTRIAIFTSLAIPLLFLAAIGLLMDFRILGRHLSPLLPALLLPIALCLDRRTTALLSWSLAGWAVVSFNLASAIQLKVLEKHARDDYRRAAMIAFKALSEGKRIWWQADMNATRYYAYREGGIPMINAIQVLESDPPSSLMFADLVVINRPDLRFRGSDYQGELRRNGFEPISKFTGFEIWISR